MNVLVVIAALVFVLDQATKWLILARFHQHEEVPVIGEFFKLTLAFNPGAAWGMFARFGHSNTILTAFSIATVLALWMLRRSLSVISLPHRIAFGMIVGGIFGNLADRIHYGCVVDFLLFYLGKTIGHWPVFNIADSAICTGVVLYLLITLWPPKPRVVPELPPDRKFGAPPAP